MNHHPPLFIHVPRTGGTSLRAALGLKSPVHIGHHQYNRSAHGPRFVMGFTRCPWDRAVSLYHLRHPRDRGTFGEWLADLELDGQVVAEMPTWHWLRAAHWVGRFEYFKHYAIIMARVLGDQRPAIRIPHKHNSERQPLSAYYTMPWMVEKVYKLYMADCVHFGYTVPEELNHG